MSTVLQLLIAVTCLGILGFAAYSSLDMSERRERDAKVHDEQKIERCVRDEYRSAELVARVGKHLTESQIERRIRLCIGDPMPKEEQCADWALQVAEVRAGTPDPYGLTSEPVALFHMQQAGCPQLGQLDAEATPKK